jgi:hypothetical protein
MQTTNGNLMRNEFMVMKSMMAESIMNECHGDIISILG